LIFENKTEDLLINNELCEKTKLVREGLNWTIV
jgi:hypothetical protein